MIKKRMMQATALALTALLIGSCAQGPGSSSAQEASSVYDPGAWKHWGGDPGQTRYAPLDQINTTNVERLQIAWRWTADASGGPAGSNFKSTPLLVDGVLYSPWLNHGMAAVDAGTGETLWTFEPQPTHIGGRRASLNPRSLAYWSDGTDARLFHNSEDGRLIAVDARTGTAAPGFGQSGWIDLRKGIIEGTPISDVSSISPAVVVGDVVVVQIIPGGSRNKESARGDIRGFDVRTGELKWTFHVVPQEGEFGNETWEDGSAAFNGASGSWTLMSSDPELGYVYVATETPANDYFGGHRPGDNLFAESIICIDTKTGERVWHFQVVHHGIWDLDLPAAPILHDIVKDGKRIKVATLLTKQNNIFVFDRATGEPIWPIEERPVPPSDIPGENLSPTQPWPTWPEPLSNQGYHEEDLIDFTPELRAEALEIASKYRRGSLYEPLVDLEATGLVGTWVYPASGGGPNWNGAAFDPDTGAMYIPIRHRPVSVGLQKGDPSRTNLAYTPTNIHLIMGPQGLPILKPPYSEMVALNMNSGDQMWRKPLGKPSPALRNHPALAGLDIDWDSMGDFDIRPSPLLTKSLYYIGSAGTFSGGTGTETFSVHDKRTGETLLEIEMPTLVSGAPMTYMHKGRQYVVVTVSDRGQPAEMIALTLDGASENGPAPANGVQLAAAPSSQTAAVEAITATAEELAMGRAAFDRTCVVCHGAPGAEPVAGNAPSLANRSDFSEIKRVIDQGKGAMPPLSSALSPAEIDAIAKFVVKELN